MRGRMRAKVFGSCIEMRRKLKIASFGDFWGTGFSKVGVPCAIPPTIVDYPFDPYC